MRMQQLRVQHASEDGMMEQEIAVHSLSFEQPGDYSMTAPQRPFPGSHAFPPERHSMPAGPGAAAGAAASSWVPGGPAGRPLAQWPPAEQESMRTPLAGPFLPPPQPTATAAGLFSASQQGGYNVQQQLFGDATRRESFGALAGFAVSPSLPHFSARGPPHGYGNAPAGGALGAFGSAPSPHAAGFVGGQGVSPFPIPTSSGGSARPAPALPPAVGARAAPPSIAGLPTQLTNDDARRMPVTFRWGTPPKGHNALKDRGVIQRVAVARWVGSCSLHSVAKALRPA